MSLNFVAGEFSPHNLPLQAVLGLIGFSERITTLVEGLPIEDAVPIEPARHNLDLTLLGLLALHDTLLVELDRRGLAPLPSVPAPSTDPDPEPSPTPPDALRRLLR
jgi:hypothetical protein